MKKIILVISALVLALGLIGCSASQSNQAPVTQAASSSQLTKSYSEFGITLKYPEGWTVSPTDNDTTFRLDSPDSNIRIIGTAFYNGPYNVGNDAAKDIEYITKFIAAMDNATSTTVDVNDFTIPSEPIDGMYITDGPAIMKIDGLNWDTEYKIIFYRNRQFSVMCAESPNASTSDRDAAAEIMASVTLDKSQADKYIDANSPSGASSSGSTSSQNASTDNKPSATSNTNSAKTYKEGMYKVGSDIPAGIYVLKQTGTVSAYYAILNSTSTSDIAANDNFDNQAIVGVNDGQYLQLERCTAVAFDQTTHTLQDSRTNGMWKVGTDIPAGTYKATQIGNIPAYFCVYNSPYSNQEIIENDNFSGSTYLTVSDGQYLVLERCSISLDS